MLIKVHIDFKYIQNTYSILLVGISSVNLVARLIRAHLSDVGFAPGDIRMMLSMRVLRSTFRHYLGLSIRPRELSRYRTRISFPDFQLVSGGAGRRLPSVNGFHPVVADGLGISAAGRNGKAVAGCGVNGDQALQPAR
jgi:hypothetical protein